MSYYGQIHLINSHKMQQREATKITRGLRRLLEDKRLKKFV